MTIKNILFILTATTLFSAHSTYTLNVSEESNHHEEWVHELVERHSIRSRDPEKTPTTPDIIEHQPSMFINLFIGKRQRFFERKRIYFGIDEFGQPCYARIWQHAANNPAFGDVKLIIVQGNSKSAKNKFKVIGTYADTSKHQQLKKSIARGGGVWDPTQNAIFAGTRDKNIGTIFEEFEKQQANQPASKIKK